MTVTLDKSHELKGNGYLLGVGGENESEQLIINIAYDVLLDKWAYIEFEQNGDKNTTERLTIENGQIVYSIPNGLLVAGHTSAQVVFRDASGFVWKSFKRQFLVSDEINASNNYPQTYSDFITEAQSLLDGITIQADKVDQVLTTEEARVAAEAERAENEATRLANETERETTEAERKTAETARNTAESARQTAETARAEAEAVRQAEFSGWADSMGNLNTYDKRLINLEEAGVGTLFDYVTDDTTAYSKTVPTNALPYARLNNIDEAVKSVKSIGKNLFDVSKVSERNGTLIAALKTTENAITVTTSASYTGNGYIALNQTLKELAQWLVVGNTYTLSAQTQSEVKRFYLTDTKKYLEFGNSFVVTEEDYNSTLVVYGLSETTGEGTGDCVISNIQIEKGETATEHEPYKATTYAIPLTDNYIKVDPNGSIVFENDSAAAVPSEIIYAVKK